MRRKSFVLVFDVPYPGDFFMSGRWWRAVKIVEGKNSEDALLSSRFTKPLSEDCEVVVATSYPPAFDVVRSRQLVRNLS
jgi:hypothetical protein